MKVLDHYVDTPVEGLQLGAYRGASISELSRIHDMKTVIETGGATLHPWNGARAKVEFDRTDPRGLLTITINGQQAVIQKDELTMVIRYAMGKMAT